MKRLIWIILAVIIILGAGAYFFIMLSRDGQPARHPGGGIKIVAAEDFYGNIAQQLGGDKVSVTSISRTRTSIRTNMNRMCRMASR